MLGDEEKAELEQAYRAFAGDMWRAVYAFSGGIAEVADEAIAEAFAQGAAPLTPSRTSDRGSIRRPSGSQRGSSSSGGCVFRSIESGGPPMRGSIRPSRRGWPSCLICCEP